MLAKQQNGHVDTILDGVVSGWAIDGTGINHPTVLFVFIDRKPISNVLNFITRGRDVTRVDKGTPRRFACIAAPHSVG